MDIRNTAGIDKILLTTKEFIVSDSHLLTVQPQAYQPNAKEEKESPLLFNKQRGQKAYFNSENFQLSINGRGISVQFNPSKILHPYELTNDDQSIREIWNSIRKDVKESGVLLPPDNELRLSRFDLADNKQMQFPISFYAPLFQSLRGKRLANKEYPSSYYFANKSREINFYDKTEEVSTKGITIDPRIMRGEVRAKKTDTVGRIYRFNDLDTMLKVGSEYRQKKYRESISKSIFSEGNNSEQLQIFTIDYDRELAILKQYREKYTRNAFQNWIGDRSLNSVCEDFGSLENLRLMLIQAGFAEKYTFRIIKDLKERIQFSSFFKSENKEQNLTNLYNEIYSKFAV